MRLGVYFDGFSAAPDMLQACREAEEAGAASVWFAQHVGYRDALSVAAAAAIVTREIMIVPTAISPYVYPAIVAAMSMATLHELAPGRCKVAVSVGNLLNLSESGIEIVRPLRTMSEYISTLRELFGGTSVYLDGQFQTLRGAHMEFGKGIQMPIYLASTGPKMLELAGRISDGILLSAGLTITNCRQCLAWAEAGANAVGRDVNAYWKAGFICLCVSEDGDSARRSLLRKLAYLFRSKGHAENIRSSGLAIDHEGIIAALARRDLDAATQLLPMEAAEAFGVAGTPSECAVRLERYLANGLTEPVIDVSGQPEQRQLAWKLIRELTGR